MVKYEHNKIEYLIPNTMSFKAFGNITIENLMLYVNSFTKDYKYNIKNIEMPIQVFKKLNPQTKIIYDFGYLSKLLGVDIIINNTQPTTINFK